MNSVLQFVFSLLLVAFVAHVDADGTAKQGPFASQLYNLIAKENANENFVVSPASIQTGLAMLYLGADGKTAEELKTGLELKGTNKETFVETLKESKWENCQLNFANRLYICHHFPLLPKFNELSAKHFHSTAESVNFLEPSATTKKITSWVEHQTKHKVKDIFCSSSVKIDTQAVLVNALYFNATWQHNFTSMDKETFNLKGGETTQVDMMLKTGEFSFGELKDLNAKALEMPYKDSNISMMVILPNDIDGLQQLEKKLLPIDLTKLCDDMKMTKVRLSLPKFKIEFKLSMQPILEKMCMASIFTKDANFTHLISGPKELIISEIIHKTLIEVYENGTEANDSIATLAGVPKALDTGEITEFKVNHPFFFVIKDKENVFFAGHVTKF